MICLKLWNLRKLLSWSFGCWNFGNWVSFLWCLNFLSCHLAWFYFTMIRVWGCKCAWGRCDIVEKESHKKGYSFKAKRTLKFKKKRKKKVEIWVSQVQATKFIAKEKVRRVGNLESKLVQNWKKNWKRNNKVTHTQHHPWRAKYKIGGTQELLALV